MEYDIFEKIQTGDWNLWNHQQQFRCSFILDNLELQSISRQTSVIKFFSRNMKYLPSKYSPTSFSNAMKQPPTKFLSRFSTNVHIYLHDWIVKMISYPRTMSSILADSFPRDDIQLAFFANVTFPSMYHYFVTDELHKAGASLVNYIILNQSPHLIKAFLLAFIGVSTDFFYSLWQKYEIEEKLIEENYIECQTENSKCLLTIFIRSLSKSLVYLSESQINLLKSLLNRSREEFGRIILKTLLPRSYVEYFQDKVKDPKQSGIYQMLQAAGSYPDSPFYKKITETITSPKFTKTMPSHRESGLINQTPIVLSLHELYVIQQIIFNGSKLKRSQSENLDPNTISKLNFDGFSIDNSIRSRIKKGFFFFPPDVCKNKLEPLYMDLDLTSFIGKAEEPIEYLLFSGSSRRQQSSISEDKYQNEKEIERNDKNNKITKFMKDFDMLIAHKSIQKYYKSLIKERQFYLFLILASYSIQCIEVPKKIPKPEKKSGIEKLDPLHVFTSRNHHESLSIFNLKFHTSVSINNLPSYYPVGDTESSTKNLNKIETQYEESDNCEKNQSDSKELKLDGEIKEKLSNVLKNFSRPNDEVSMFVLARKLDFLESKDRVDGINDSQVNESIQNFKNSIEKLKENTQKIINQIDQNDSYGKYIKICAVKIDSLGSQSHFEMILGLMDIGLVLNEISIQISKKVGNNSDRYLETMKSLLNCLFMYSNNKMFDVFIWYHHFINTFPEFRKVFPKCSRNCIDFLINYFYEFYYSNDEMKNQI